jgi:hypothetical protein
MLLGETGYLLPGDTPQEIEYSSIFTFVLWFYLTWSSYWGICDLYLAEQRHSDRRANRLLDAVLAVPLASRISVVKLAVVFVVIVYSLLGGGVYGFYCCLKESRD